MSKNSGFSLIELLVVIAIIAVLAAVVTPPAFRAIEKAQIARTIVSLKGIRSAALAYYTETGQWPQQHYLIDNTGPFFKDPGLPGWDGPYLERYEKSPLVQPGVPGGSYPGWYYIINDNQLYGSSYDLNRDGNYDIVDGISVACYGFPAKFAYRIDEMLDGVGEWGYLGRVNVIRISSTGAEEPYYLVTLLIGQTGVPRGSR